MGTSHWVPLDQVQGNVTPGFRKDFQAFLFFRFPQTAPGGRRTGGQGNAPGAQRLRDWLRAVVPSVVSAEEVATFNRLYRLVKQRIDGTDAAQAGVKQFIRSTWVNIAFTAKGLGLLLGAEPWKDDPRLRDRLKVFRQGMCYRNLMTGDEETDLVEFQVRDGVRSDLVPLGKSLEAQAEQVYHALVMIGADTEEELEAEIARQVGLAEGNIPDAPLILRGASLGNGREHFGFTDGLSQPDPPDPLGGWIADDEQVVAPGEIIRGCEPEPAHAEPWDVPAWERFGSYLVFRQLEQDVGRFWSQAQRVAETLFGHFVEGAQPGESYGPILTPTRSSNAAPPNNASHSGNAITPNNAANVGNASKPDQPSLGAQYAAALMMGRWRSGATLTAPLEPLGPGEPPRFPRDPAPGQRAPAGLAWLGARDFAQDPDGSTCPMFAHIRRANPRVAMPTLGQEELRLHRIVRRGIPYATGKTRGLMFLAYQARIDEGYEVIQHDWINSGSFGGSADGAERPGPDALAVPSAQRPENQFIPPLGREDTAATSGTISISLSRTVIPRGGGYFFAPSLKVLATLASDGFRTLR